MRALGLIIATLLLSLLSIAPAHADGFPPPFGDTGDTDPNPGGPGNNPGGSNPGGGGLGAPPAGTRWVYGGFNVTQEVFNGYQSFGANGYTIAWRCDPKDVNGDSDWFATGVNFVHLIYIDTAEFAGGFSYSCVYPPKPQDAIATCHPWLHATIARKVPSTQTLVDKRVTTAWGNNRESVAACATSATIEVNTRLRDLGGYQVDVTGRSMRCTVRSYPGTNRATRIVLPCGNPSDDTHGKKAAVWCDNGVKWAIGDNSWNGKAPWDWERCTGEQGELINCVSPSQSVTFRGVDATGRPVRVLKDGKARALTYQPLAVQGLRNVRDVASRLDVDGQPLRNHDVNASDQPAHLSNGARFEDWANGDVLTYGLIVNAAGVEGDDLTFDRRVRFTGTLDAQTITISSINFDTMQMETSTTTVPMTVTSQCHNTTATVAPYGTRISNGY